LEVSARKVLTFSTLVVVWICVEIISIQGQIMNNEKSQPMTTEALVLRELAQNSNLETGRYEKGLPTLAKACGRSKEAVRKCLYQLAKEGLVRIIARVGEDGGAAFNHFALGATKEAGE
jgi:hypothetical protein